MSMLFREEILLAWLGRGLVLGVIFFVIQGHAKDSTVNTPVSVNSATSSGGGTGACDFYMKDVFGNASAPSGSPPGTSCLTFAPMGTFAGGWNYPGPPCAGVYEVTFAVEVQATTNEPVVAVKVEIGRGDGTSLIYPTGLTTNGERTNASAWWSSGPSLTSPDQYTYMIYPQCNNTNYSQPYCTMNWISGAAQVQLPSNQVLDTVCINPSSPLRVIGGEISYRYLHP